MTKPATSPSQNTDPLYEPSEAMNHAETTLDPADFAHIQLLDGGTDAAACSTGSCTV